MLNWALMFFAAAVVAAVCAAFGEAEVSAHVGWLFLVTGTILLVVSLVTSEERRRGPPVL
jgi:uncharacterized membrane protein YtjA (UPF0391 family)